MLEALDLGEGLPGDEVKAKHRLVDQPAYDGLRSFRCPGCPPGLMNVTPSGLLQPLHEFAMVAGAPYDEEPMLLTTRREARLSFAH